MSSTSTIEEPREHIRVKDAPNPAKGLAHSPRILLVDDDAGVRDLYAQILILSGFQVDTAEDGEAGWVAIHSESFTPESYDLLITDNNMPRLTGVALIKMVRSSGMNLPIILASGNPPADTEALRLSAVLPKPFTGEELVQTVKRALQFSARKE